MTNRSSLQNPLVWIAVLVVAAAAIAGAIALTGGDDADEVESGSTFETGPVDVTGTGLPGMSNPDPAVGTPVPTFEAVGFDGATTTIGGDGRPRLYGFFAHWCPHCQAELPGMTTWLLENDIPGDVDIVAVSTGVSADADNYPPSAWFAREGWPDDVVVDSDDAAIARAFGLTAYPYWVGADAAGNVAFRGTGSLTEAQLETVLNLLANT